MPLMREPRNSTHRSRLVPQALCMARAQHRLSLTCVVFPGGTPCVCPMGPLLLGGDGIPRPNLWASALRKLPTPKQFSHPSNLILHKFHCLFINREISAKDTLGAIPWRCWEGAAKRTTIQEDLPGQVDVGEAGCRGAAHLPAYGSLKNSGWTNLRPSTRDTQLTSRRRVMAEASLS